MIRTDHPHYDPDIAHIQLLEGRLPAGDYMWREWHLIKTVLDEGLHTRREIAERTGLRQARVKGYLYYGYLAGVIFQEELRREVEVAPGVWMLKPVRAYRSGRQPKTHHREESA